MADEAWNYYRNRPVDEYWQYVLVTEWADEVESRCCGELLRGWIQDNLGVKELSIEECEKQRKLIRQSKFPYVLIRFHIAADCKSIVYNQRTEVMVASGSKYLVVGEGSEAKLQIDPKADNWQMSRDGIKTR